MIALPQLLAGVLALTVGDVESPRPIRPRRRRPRPKPCATPQHRQFDFWLGDWDVTKPDGKAAGHNRITVILGGCALREEWTGASGTHGTSLNMFDAGARKWRQTWVDDGGTVLLLTGEFKGGKMVLEGDSPAGRRRDGAPAHHLDAAGRRTACVSSGSRRPTAGRPGRSSSTGRTRKRSREARVGAVGRRLPPRASATP